MRSYIVYAGGMSFGGELEHIDWVIVFEEHVYYEYISILIVIILEFAKFLPIQYAIRPFKM